MWAVESVSLILLVDQLEDIYNLDEAEVRFRRAMATVCDLADRIPSSVAVVSCLEDYYQSLRAHLTGPVVDRIEKDPEAIPLASSRETGEVANLIASRLKYLFESVEAEFKHDQPTFPIPNAELQKLVGQRTRDILAECHSYREQCIATGRIILRDGGTGRGTQIDITHLELAWNDFHTGFTTEISHAEEDLATILAVAIEGCSSEVKTGHWFEAEVEGRMIPVERHATDDAVDKLLVGICNKDSRGNGLKNQITEVVNRAGENTPVIVRSTEFPSSPRAADRPADRQADHPRGPPRRRRGLELAHDAGHASVPRTALLRPGLLGLAEGREPLSRLNSLRTILDLDELKAMRTDILRSHRATD